MRSVNQLSPKVAISMKNTVVDTLSRSKSPKSDQMNKSIRSKNASSVRRNAPELNISQIYQNNRYSVGVNRLVSPISSNLDIDILESPGYLDNFGSFNFK